MQKIYKNSYKSEICLYSNEKSGTLNEILSLNIDDLIIQQHKKNADTTYFYFKDDNSQNDILILLTQDNDLIKELKMIQNTPKKTVDILATTENISNIKIANLFNNSLENKIDYQLCIDNRNYSFRLVKGFLSNKLIKKLENYRDELENVENYKIKI